MRYASTITAVCLRKDRLAELGRNVLGIIRQAFRNLSKVLFEELPSPVTAKSPTARGARDCVLVLDESGSMRDDDWKPSRLEAAKTAAKAFVARLSKEQPDARIAVVAFGSRAKTVCRLTAARETDRIFRAIDRINGHGSTDMCAGLKKALDLFGDHKRDCQVVLLTDGHADRSPRRPANALKEFSVIECVGIGGSPDDVDTSLLTDLASAYPDGRKRYRWIGDEEQLIQHFHNLAGAIRRVCQ
jgi:Mg-chelatase subunit ChlD